MCIQHTNAIVDLSFFLSGLHFADPGDLTIQPLNMPLSMQP